MLMMLFVNIEIVFGVRTMAHQKIIQFIQLYTDVLFWLVVVLVGGGFDIHHNHLHNKHYHFHHHHRHRLYNELKM